MPSLCSFRSPEPRAPWAAETLFPSARAVWALWEEGLAHLKMNTRAYLHGKKIFLLKYSLSNKNVAERRRDWPA